MISFKKTPKNKAKQSMTSQSSSNDDERMATTPLVGKKGTNSSMKTPNTGKSTRDVHVSFQIPKGSPPKSTFRGRHPPTPMPRKKEMNVSAKKQKSMAEFKGMKDSPTVVKSSKKSKRGQDSALQMSLANLSDDDDEDDKDLNFAQMQKLKSKMEAIGKKKKEMSGKNKEDDEEEDDEEDNEDEEEDNEDEEEDDEDEEEDDEDDEDDDDLESSDEECTSKLKKLKEELQQRNMLDNKSKTLKSKSGSVTKKLILKSEDSDEEDEDKESGFESDFNKQLSVQKKKPKQILSLKEVSPKIQLKQERSSTKSLSPDAVMQTQENRKKQRDARRLFVRRLPPDISVEELKTLSSDIIDVHIPHRKHKREHVYAFLEFINEKKAEANHAALKGKKFKGQELFIDFCGEKSENYTQRLQKIQEMSPRKYDKSRLSVMDLPVGTNIVHLANLFPKAIQIFLNNTIDYRNASVLFKNQGDAEEALKKTEKAKIEGKSITVLYAIVRSLNKKRKQGNKPRSSFAKKPKLENEESDDEDDDGDTN